MSAETWVDDNRRYLAVSLNWMRQRLQPLAPPAPVQKPATAASAPAPTTVIVVPSPARPQRTWFGQRTPVATAAPGTIALPSATPATPPATTTAAPPSSAPAPAPADEPTPVDRLMADRDSAAQVDPPPALVMLQRSFRLTDFERDTLLLCAAVELDPGIAILYANAPGQAGRAYPTFALALQILEHPTWEAISPQHPLRQARLLEIAATPATPLATSALRIDERIANYLKGLNALDERLAALVSPPTEADLDILSASQQDVADQVLVRLRNTPSDGSVPVVQLLGQDTVSKQAVARQVCKTVDRHLYTLALDVLPTQRTEIDALARLWQRESALLPVALYLDAQALEDAHGDLRAALQAFIAREPGLLFVGLRDAPTVPTARHVFEVHKPTVAEQARGWQAALSAALGDDATAAAQQLAGQFDLNLDDIHHAAARATVSTGSGTPLAKAWDASRDLTRPRLDALAQRLDSLATWDDLVLPDEAAYLLRQIATQVRGRFRVYEDWGYAKKMTRGRGIGVLFAGESGTGKTMAAEVIANELRLNLYRIDLSAVVSKYIGETEKNLRRLFDAAEMGGAILFFDEADALFGKRSDVKDSHDRYANIEINYLLQRMEAFSGLAILATNMKSALDPAFMRRLRFIVNFPFPGPAQRREMWAKAFPSELPQQALDIDKLSRFNLSGGNIHSVALNAAFAAAHRGTAVTQPLLLSAVRAELRKLDKPINEAEFR